MAEARNREELSDRLVVGIGASAGGLAALEEFVAALPSDPGMSFVIVTHRGSGQTNLLPELLARRCKLPVVGVDQPTKIEPDHIYVASVPTLGLADGMLVPFDPNDGDPRPLTIDFLFRSLAREHRERAVGIVLSGTGSDGTNGLREIRAASGVVMAQDEASASYPSMPHNARVGVELDFVLPPRDMVPKLLALRDGLPRREEVEDPEAGGADVSHILLLLRNRTGHDFSGYKEQTVARRLRRRMGVNQIGSLDDYLKFVQTTPQELDNLFKDLLIGVTSFFRDPEVFEVLARDVIPRLLEGRQDGDTVRVWIAGCSTGEEAYSIAILFHEATEQAGVRVGAQLFATDLDADAIEVARAGVYPAVIAGDVSPARLERFFVAEDGGYRIKKDVRQGIVFAVQDLVEDPAFTKLDLLVCRNVLIYLNSDVQSQLMRTFHYAIRPGGILVLGPSEAGGGLGESFDVLDKKCKVFQRSPRAPVGPPRSPTPETQELGARERVAWPRRADYSLGHLAERAILQALVPPSVIIQQSGQIVHVHGRTGQFLEPAPGHQADANVFNMVRQGLEIELTLALRRAATSSEEVLVPAVRVQGNGSSLSVNLRVRRLTQPALLRGLFLVAFEPAAQEVVSPPERAMTNGPGADRLAELERELTQTKEFHQDAIEELETTNEELKSANEELQSMNEELQSSNEELETSKEEMQSLNEELHTVNAELEEKLDELSRINDDMKNLLNATDIATLFLDNELNVKRYTEQAKRVVRLIPSDVGRPIADLASSLQHSTLVEDARQVLRTLAFKQTEVQTEEGLWYQMRIMPYRTTENVIDGLVITFVDVTKLRDLKSHTDRLLRALALSPTTVCGLDAELRYHWCYGDLFGQPASQALGRTDQELLECESASRLSEIKRQALERAQPVREQVRVQTRAGTRLYDVFVEPRDLEGGGLICILTELEEATK